MSSDWALNFLQVFGEVLSGMIRTLANGASDYDDLHTQFAYEIARNVFQKFLKTVLRGDLRWIFGVYFCFRMLFRLLHR